MQATALREPENRARPILHRVGTVRAEDMAEAVTIGGRIRERRIELGMTQEQVADLCHITQKSNSQRSGRMKGDTFKLSRSAYCMYETDSVTPVLDVLEQIAGALRTSPEWISFGRGNKDPVPVMGYRRKVDEFAVSDTWDMPGAWLRETYGVAPTEVALVPVLDPTPMLAPGDIALVRREVEPTRAAGGEFAYGLCDGSQDVIMIDQITRPAKGGPYRVYSADLHAHTDVDPGDIKILGKVIGRVTPI